MKGWHYTSYRNWQNIQKQGFKIYPINKPEIDVHFPDPVEGIWTWVSRPQGESELGSILFQAATKQITRVVLLEFDYDEADILRTATGNKVDVYHNGIMGNWLYHEGQAACIVTKAIAPEDIKLVKDVNLMDLVPPDLGVEIEETIETEDIFGQS